MTTDVIVLRPSTDSVEKTLSMWVDLLFPPGTPLPGLSVVHDVGLGASAAVVHSICPSGDIILFFGHGTETTLGDPVLLDTSSVVSASGSTVIAIACLSGEDLGWQAVMQQGVHGYLGFTEPLFVYQARPSTFGSEIADRIKSFLIGTASLAQVCADLISDFQVIESMYHSGYYANNADAPLVWMGARMNWRGLVAH